MPKARRNEYEMIRVPIYEEARVPIAERERMSFLQE